MKTAQHHKQRTYRQLVHGHLRFSRVTVQETDLGIYATSDVREKAKELVMEQRGYLEGYIRRHGQFMHSLVPLEQDDLAPSIVRQMLLAGKCAHVGPMAAVAGALAEAVGQGLLKEAQEVIVENGGDIFIQCKQPLTVAVFAGDSPLSLKIGLKVDTALMPIAVCTSSGTVGHSLSKGLADAVCVLSASCPLADAAATAIGNRVRRKTDIEPAIQWGKAVTGVEGILIVVGDQMGMWGKITLVPLVDEPSHLSRTSY